MLPNRKAYETLPLLACFVLYICYLLSFLIGYINSDQLVMSLLLLMICQLVVLFRNKRYFRKRSLILPLMGIIILLLYEGIFLMMVDTVTYYVEPEEIIDGTGIFVLSVGTVPIKNVEEKKLHAFPFFPIEEEKNTPLEIYSAKNRAYCQLISVCPEEFQVMERNVTSYLGKETHFAIQQFFKKTNYAGESAGLMLVISQLVYENKIENDEKIAITGAITKNGEVKQVGVIREKVLTAAASGISYVIVPLENKEEALKIRDAYHFQLDIYGVGSIEEALTAIKEINNR